MRGRAALTGVVTGALVMSTAMPAAALLGGLTEPITDTTESTLTSAASLLGTTTDPVLSTLSDLDGLVEGVLDDLGTGTLEPAVVETLLDTGSADEPVHDLLGYGWSEHLPAYPDEEYVPSVYDDCPPGHNACVDQVIREMGRRYDKLGCDHAAIFSLTYKLTTEEYRASVEDPDYFRDNAFVNHQDVVFADHYFAPMDDWFKHDRIDRVPPAWRIAFDAGERRAVSTTGDVMLGMNAHIRRDLPFVLAAIGMVTEDGESRKHDHDRVNDFLAKVQATITEELQRRHDPDFGGTALPASLDEHAIMHAIRLWREEAWRKAELLVSASTEDGRQRVAELIEADAAISALAITEAFAADDGEVREAHCEAWRAS